MRVELEIEFIELKVPEDYLSKPDEYLRPLIKLMMNLPFWNILQYHGRWGSKNLKPFKEAEELIKASASWKNYDYILASDKTTTPVCGIVITPFSDSIALQIIVGEPVNIQYNDRLLDDLVEFTTKVHQTFKDKAIFGPRLGITIHGIEYPRPRPPYNDPIWGPHRIVDFASKAFYQSSDDGELEQFNTLVNAEMPVGVEKFELHDLLVIKWADDLSDEKVITEKLSLHDSWFSKTLNLRLQGGFNTLGDQMESYEVLEKHQYLTFYDTFTKFGYKAIVINPDGSVDEELFEEMQDWIVKSATPDGSFIKELNIITSDRESALSITDKALSIGVSRVLYVDIDDNWWNPSPPGLWI